jgi:putative tryptophan/tyrosine transport system substrate-binding protein
MSDMRRREFITLLGGAAAAWPVAARAQQPAMRRVGFLSGLAEGDPEVRDRIAAFRDGLEKLGWTDGNIELNYRFGAGNRDRLWAQAGELVQLKPDVLFASANTALAALRQATQDIPIVFAQVTDPVGAGIVASLARPGGNITGLTQHEYSIGVKWLELLKELAPRVKRVAVVYDADNPAAAGYLAEITAGVPTFQVQLTSSAVRNTSEIERAIEAIAAGADAGLIVLPGPAPSARRDQIITLAERHRLPTVFAFRYWVMSGGLASYGIDNIDLYRRAASYVDRILKGEKAAELPVQHATKFQLVINLKTAKALGLDPPITLLARTDEVIE